MMRPHQSLARLAIAVALSIPTTVLMQPTTLHAQDATAPAAATGPEIPAELATAVENYWHYGKIARYDLQNAEAEKILAAGADPAVVLAAFEKTSTARGDVLDNWILRWQGVKDASETATKVAQLLQTGRGGRKADQNYIEAQIARLSTGERPYILAIGQLKQSGELAVPLLVASLQKNPVNTPEHNAARRALRDLGRSAVNPLVAATEIKKDTDTLLAVIAVLSDIGYDAPVPYLLRLAQSSETSDSVKNAALTALKRMSGTDRAAADAFYELAERIYYGKSALSVDEKAPVAYVWYWDEDKGLTKKDVPAAIFGPVMAMRSAEYSLKLGKSRGDALSLWLAGNYKREASLAEGQTDSTRMEGNPSAHFYGVSAGAQHLYTTLDRALRDGDAGVAVRAIRSLREIVGSANLPIEAAEPLVAALRFPDRLVRYEAAFALASANPSQAFAGSERVVPLLAEAVSQTGATNVVVLALRGGGEGKVDLNATLDGLKSAGVGAVGGATAQEAVSAANTLPAVDAIIISEDIAQSEIDTLVSLTGASPRLERTPRIVIVKSAASPFVMRAATDSLLSTTQNADAAALKASVEAARSKSGSLPLNDTAAAEYAVKSANLLEWLAGRSQAYDLLVAEGSLQAALGDARPDIVKAAGATLSMLDSQNVQPALLAAAGGEKAADDVKVSLYKSLASHAKQFGDRLNADQHATLDKVVVEGTNLDVRSAAAEVRGALNLPADQAKALIIKQSKT